MDFDSSRLADPALDVGYFLADWQFRQADLDQAGTDQLYESFLAAYVSRASKDFLMRIRLYEAVELVKCAVRRVQLFEDDCASRMSALVERAQWVIDDVQRTLILRARRFSVARSVDTSLAEKRRCLQQGAASCKG